MNTPQQHFNPSRRDALKWAGAAGLATAGLPSMAQSGWPSKPIRWIVPFAPGGTSSIVARTIAAELTKQMGVSFVIDNKGGGGGVPAMQEMMRLPADGYTIVMSHIGLMAVNPLIYPDSGYDVNKDFVPVTLLSRVPSLFVVHKDVPARNVKELVAYIRSRPGRLNYASAGNASAGHLAMEAFKLATNTFITHIPYRGTGPALTDVLAGRIELFSAGTPALLPHIKSGALRCIAVGTRQRIPVLPDVPTMAERLPQLRDGAVVRHPRPCWHAARDHHPPAAGMCQGHAVGRGQVQVRGRKRHCRGRPQQRVRRLCGHRASPVERGGDQGADQAGLTPTCPCRL